LDFGEAELYIKEHSSSKKWRRCTDIRKSGSVLGRL